MNDIDIDRKGNFCPDSSYPFDRIFNGNNYKLKGEFPPGGGLFSNIDGAVIENRSEEHTSELQSPS